jgi:peptidoglycan/LPS O-acetylase OafA/YrhL
MVGYLRFILAALVLYSHLNYPLWGIGELRINQGVFAVFCFYLISGFFTAVIYNRYENSEAQVRNYFIDRLLRLIPTFVVVMLAVLLINLVWYEPSLKAGYEDYRQPYYWVLGLLQPLNGAIGFFMKGDFPYGPFFAFTPVASLALEVKYFTVFPFFAKIHRKWIVIAIILSSALIIFAALSRNPDLLEDFTYRNLVGVLPLFLLGFLFLQNLQSTSHVIFRFDVLAVLLGVVFLLVLHKSNLMTSRWLGEMAVAMIVCPFLFKFAMRYKSSKLDQLAGYLSYGVFLVHIPVLRFLHLKGESYSEFFLALALATGIAFVIHISIEKPVLAIRHRMAGAGIKSYILNKPWQPGLRIKT